MISKEIRDTYKVVVGLEVHCQLLTESKIFAADPNIFGVDANTNIGVITLAHPGVLPKLNKKAVEYAIKLGLACGSEINPWQYFDRKNYFYPDLPKGYQTTQDKTPICLGGNYPIRYKNADGQEVTSTIQIHHIHMEEDAGKSIHTESDTETMLDYNRAGTPLLEMVTEPCLSSGEEAAAFMFEMRKLVRYLGIGDGNMEEGSLRCDVNVSVMKTDATEYGTKVEIKNMNSMRFINKAIDHEIVRQITTLEAGGKIVQETRSFDPATNTTGGMREKETMNDYRYFPEPDLPPFEIPATWVEQVRALMPPLPNSLYEKYTNTLGLSAYDASNITDSLEMAQFFEGLLDAKTPAKAAANWLMGPIKALLNEGEYSIENFPVKATTLSQAIALVEQNKISSTVAQQQLLPLLVKNPEANPLDLATNNNWILQSDTNALEQIVNDVLASMPDKVAEYKKGKKGLLALFMGEVMKRSKGSADPKICTKLLQEKLA
jgi:aspartyl-tRNA(Asn)/glutamyl-tRNA(Gln) amidotransferase subunit B